MKNQTKILSLAETERLCQLYMDTRLSVMEETELQYILSRLEYRSPLIDETRKIMGIELAMAQKPISTKLGTMKKRRFFKQSRYIAAVASFALVLSLGVLLHNVSIDNTESDSYYIAYVDGHRISDKEARVRIEAEQKSADEFIRKMNELEASKQQLIDNFLNH